MSLSTYITDNQTACFEKHGVFFAFSKAQLDEQKKEGVEYVGLGAGTVCPKDNVKAFITDHANIITNGIAQDITANGVDAIIERELSNYECYYTGDIESCVDALKSYGIAEGRILKVYNNTRMNYD